MKKMLLLLSTLFTFNAFAETGILFIAHGTMKHDEGGGHQHLRMACTSEGQWESYVLSTLKAIKGDIPQNFEVAFGMWDSHCFDEAIHRLEKTLASKGSTLDHLVVFPLFISSESSVIDMQKFIFKKRPDRVLDIPSVHQTHFAGQITYLSAFDYDPQVSMILANRLSRLVSKAQNRGFAPEQMELVLVMHGPVEDDANLKWMAMGERYNRDITYLFPVGRSHVLSLRDDAPPEVRNKATKELQALVSGAQSNGKIALVLPLLIAKGGIDAGIVARLEGLDYIWSGESIFPDVKMKDAILNRLEKLK